MKCILEILEHLIQFKKMNIYVTSHMIENFKQETIFQILNLSSLPPLYWIMHSKKVAQRKIMLEWSLPDRVWDLPSPPPTVSISLKWKIYPIENPCEEHPCQRLSVRENAQKTFCYNSVYNNRDWSFATLVHRDVTFKVNWKSSEKFSIDH